MGGGGGRGKEKFNNYFIIHFLNNLLKKTPWVCEHFKEEGLGNLADFKLDMINAK